MADDRTGASIDNPPGVTRAPSEYNPQPYLEALDVLQRNARRNLVRCLIVRVMAYLLCVPWVAFDILEQGQIAYWYLIGLALLLEIVQPVFAALLMSNYASKFDEQFLQSGLAERIALGEFDAGDSIYGHTPWLLRWLMQRNPSGNPLGTLSRVAGSLAWYLAAPRIHLKLTWMTPLAFVFVIVFLPVLMWSVHIFWISQISPFMILLLIVLWMINNLFVMQFVRVELLAKHLRLAWESSPPEAVTTSHEVERKAKLQLMLNQVQQDLEKALFMLHAPILIPLMCGVYPIVKFNWQMFELLPLILFGILILAIVTLTQTWLPRHGFSDYRRDLREQLDHSSIPQLIASGELDCDGLIEHTPWVFRFVHRVRQMPRGFADNLRILIWRAALNLDWYLDHPKRFLRASWITNILLFFAGLGTLAFGVMTPVRSETRLSMYAPYKILIPSAEEMLMLGIIRWTLFAVVIALAVPCVIHATKARIWVEELIRHLRAKLAG